MTKTVSGHRKKTRKKIRKSIYVLLSIALSDYSTMIDKKEFDKSLQKMARSFTADLLKAHVKKEKKSTKD